MLPLRHIRYEPPDNHDAFPFSVPALQTFTDLALTTPVTFLVGENGSGKSTFMEALAVAAGSVAAGSTHLRQDPSLAAVRPLALRLQLTWNRRSKKGFFLRAEDFFGYIKDLGHKRAELEADLRETERNYKDRSASAKQFAQMPYRRELHALDNQYGRDLSTYSHGESFLEFFQARFVPSGLHLLDEPEAPLSPVRQLGFLSLLKQMVTQDAQFIIATHSPIILAFPGAIILSFDEGVIRPVPYEELEHVTLTRLFLNNPEQFLHHL